MIKQQQANQHFGSRWISFSSKTNGKLSFSTTLIKKHWENKHFGSRWWTMKQNLMENTCFWWRRSFLNNPYRIWAFCVYKWETPIEVPRLDLQTHKVSKSFSARCFKNERNIMFSDIQPANTYCFLGLLHAGWRAAHRSQRRGAKLYTQTPDPPP